MSWFKRNDFRFSRNDFRGRDKYRNSKFSDNSKTFFKHSSIYSRDKERKSDHHHYSRGNRNEHQSTSSSSDVLVGRPSISQYAANRYPYLLGNSFVEKIDRSSVQSLHSKSDNEYGPTKDQRRVGRPNAPFPHENLDYKNITGHPRDLNRREVSVEKFDRSSVQSPELTPDYEYDSKDQGRSRPNAPFPHEKLDYENSTGYAGGSNEREESSHWLRMQDLDEEFFVGRDHQERSRFIEGSNNRNVDVEFPPPLRSERNDLEFTRERRRQSESDSERYNYTTQSGDERPTRPINSRFIEELERLSEPGSHQNIHENIYTRNDQDLERTEKRLWFSPDFIRNPDSFIYEREDSLDRDRSKGTLNEHPHMRERPRFGFVSGQDQRSRQDSRPSSYQREKFHTNDTLMQRSPFHESYPGKYTNDVLKGDDRSHYSSSQRAKFDHRRDFGREGGSKLHSRLSPEKFSSRNMSLGMIDHQKQKPSRKEQYYHRSDPSGQFYDPDDSAVIDREVSRRHSSTVADYRKEISPLETGTDQYTVAERTFVKEKKQSSKNTGRAVMSFDVEKEMAPSKNSQFYREKRKKDHQLGSSILSSISETIFKRGEKRMRTDGLLDEDGAAKFRGPSPNVDVPPAPPPPNYSGTSVPRDYSKPLPFVKTSGAQKKSFKPSQKPEFAQKMPAPREDIIKKCQSVISELYRKRNCETGCFFPVWKTYATKEYNPLKFSLYEGFTFNHSPPCLNLKPKESKHDSENISNSGAGSIFVEHQQQNPENVSQRSSAIEEPVEDHAISSTPYYNPSVYLHSSFSSNIPLLPTPSHSQPGEFIGQQPYFGPNNAYTGPCDRDMNYSYPNYNYSHVQEQMYPSPVPDLYSTPSVQETETSSIPGFSYGSSHIMNPQIQYQASNDERNTFFHNPVIQSTPFKPNVLAPTTQKSNKLNSNLIDIETVSNAGQVSVSAKKGNKEFILHSKHKIVRRAPNPSPNIKKGNNAPKKQAIKSKPLPVCSPKIRKESNPSESQVLKTKPVAHTPTELVPCTSKYSNNIFIIPSVNPQPSQKSTIVLNLLDKKDNSNPISRAEEVINLASDDDEDDVLIVESSQSRIQKSQPILQTCTDAKQILEEADIHENFPNPGEDDDSKESEPSLQSNQSSAPCVQTECVQNEESSSQNVTQEDFSSQNVTQEEFSLKNVTQSEKSNSLDETQNEESSPQNEMIGLNSDKDCEGIIDKIPSPPPPPTSIWVGSDLPSPPSPPVSLFDKLLNRAPPPPSPPKIELIPPPPPPPFISDFAFSHGSSFSNKSTRSSSDSRRRAPVTKRRNSRSPSDRNRQSVKTHSSRNDSVSGLPKTSQSRRKPMDNPRIPEDEIECVVLDSPETDPEVSSRSESVFKDSSGQRSEDSLVRMNESTLMTKINVEKQATQDDSSKISQEASELEYESVKDIEVPLSSNEWQRSLSNFRFIFQKRSKLSEYIADCQLKNINAYSVLKSGRANSVMKQMVFQNDILCFKFHASSDPQIVTDGCATDLLDCIICQGWKASLEELKRVTEKYFCFIPNLDALLSQSVKKIRNGTSDCPGCCDQIPIDSGRKQSSSGCGGRNLSNFNSIFEKKSKLSEYIADCQLKNINAYSMLKSGRANSVTKQMVLINDILCFKFHASSDPQIVTDCCATDLLNCIVCQGWNASIEELKSVTEKYFCFIPNLVPLLRESVKKIRNGTLDCPGCCGDQIPTDSGKNRISSDCEGRNLSNFASIFEKKSKLSEYIEHCQSNNIPNYNKVRSNPGQNKKMFFLNGILCFKFHDTSDPQIVVDCCSELLLKALACHGRNASLTDLRTAAEKYFCVIPESERKLAVLFKRMSMGDLDCPGCCEPKT